MTGSASEEAPSRLGDELTQLLHAPNTQVAAQFLPLKCRRNEQIESVQRLRVASDTSNAETYDSAVVQ